MVPEALGDDMKVMLYSGSALGQWSAEAICNVLECFPRAAFDHLVGAGEQRRRHRQPERRRGLEVVDGKFKFGGRLRRKFGRVGPFRIRSTYEAERRKMSEVSGPYDIRPPSLMSCR
jgi:hypothetical protein